VIGESINDCDSLKNADVGFSTGSGAAYARNVSQIVITDNDLRSLIKAIFWGRNIYHSIRKFLQFQLTVNISCLSVVFLGTLIL
jgi:P-type E1-E2 ATPase